MKRERLPNRRHCETFSFECAGMRDTASLAYFADGRLAEIFLSNHKNGSAADTNARDAAIVTSLALQHGAPLEVIRKALCRNSTGIANGPLAVALDLIAEGR
jgi:hypothetical protein